MSITVDVLSAALALYMIMPSLEALPRLYPRFSMELHVDDRMVDMAQQGIDLAIRTGDPGSDALVARSCLVRVMDQLVDCQTVPIQAVML